MKRLVHAAFAASLLASTAALAMGPTPHTTPSTSTSHAAGKVTRDVAVALNDAQKAAQAGDMQGALADIKKAQAVPGLTDHDNFVINQFMSAVAANLRDYPTAMTAYDQMMASPDFQALDPKDQALSYHDGMIVASDVQQWDKVLTFGQALEGLQGNDDITYTTVAIAYYNKKDNKNAAVYAQKAIDYAKAHNKTAPDQAQQLVMANVVATDPKAAARQLELIAIDKNEPDDWYKLSQFILGKGKVKPIDALYLFRLQFMAGAMEQGEDYTFMAQLCEQLGYSNEEVKAYDAGIQAGKVTQGSAGAKYGKAKRDAASDERVLGQIAAAAEKAKTGEQSVKLAEDYWGYGRYADAEAAARAGIARGYPKDPTEGQMILGQALLAQGKFDEAISTFGAVTTSDPGRTDTAHLWSAYAQARTKAGH
ncbi:MAG TPA: tetratricopeptide repeat protein [Rhizomicrobium sp.]|jgi:tetratricopeptide (TPR) repeat protein